MCNSPAPVQNGVHSQRTTRKRSRDVSVEANKDLFPEDSVRAGEARLRLALEAACVGVWDWNLTTGEQWWSAQHYALFGLDKAHASGTYQDFAARVHPEDWEELQQAVQSARDTGAEYRHEYRVHWPDGTEHWLAGHGRFFYDEAGNATRMTGVLMDVTERHWLLTEMQAQMAQAEKAYQELETSRSELERANVQLAQANARLEELATTDELTGLKNKRALETFLEQEYEAALRYHRPLSVILLDVDEFKLINDRSGHPAGDAVLRRMGELLQAHKRQSDLIARYGGEEFMYVLPDTEARGAIAFAERVRAALETFPWQEPPVTASFGVATRTEAAQDVTDLIAQADRALYCSKRAGRNCVTHFADVS